ncbi:MAG: PKD domain-containing protein [Thermoplasmata archaeon]|nr:PKD domain-containing protein [Thermoplasmata archaeon]
MPALNAQPSPGAIPAPASHVSETWNEVYGAPPGLVSSANVTLAEDPPMGGVVFFGGYSPLVGALGDTWVYHNGTWTDISASLTASPAARWGNTLTWYPSAGAVVLFGGRNATKAFNDTWTLNATDVTDRHGWQNVTKAIAPPPRLGAATFYDPTNSSIVLYGGACLSCGTSGSAAAFNDTWKFAAGAWTNATVSGSINPGRRDSAYSAWDPDLNGGVLFGGDSSGAGCADSNETWLYRSSWQLLTTNGTPGALDNGGLVWYAGGDELVLFGGIQSGSGGCVAANQTAWTLQHYNWTNVTTSSGAGSGIGSLCCAGAAYDPYERLVVLFGGDDGLGSYFNNTWVYPALPLSAGLSFPFPEAENGTPFRILSVVSGGQPNLTFEWEYGDGSPDGTGVDGLHTYTSPGTYTVNLTVTDSVGRTANVSTRVGVVPALQIRVNSTSLTGEPPYAITFNATATGGVLPLTWNWNFGDHSIWASANVTHLYRIGGTFTATLMVNDSLGADRTASFVAHIYGALVAHIAASSVVAIAPVMVNFSADLAGGSGGFVYEWTFLPGANATAQNVAFTFTQPGSYNVTVVVHDSLGYGAMAFVVVNVYAPLTSSAKASTLLALAPANDNFTAEPTGGAPPLYYRWDFGDHTPTVPGVTTSHQYLTGANYTVSLTVTDALGDLAITSLIVQVVNRLTVGANASSTDGPSPLNVVLSSDRTGGLAPFSYLWAFGDGSTGSGATQMHSYSPGNFTAHVQATDALGENVTASVQIVVFQGLTLSVDASPTNLTLGNVTTLTATIAGGVAPINVRWAGLPNGCLSHNAAVVDCDPVEVGAFVITATATDGARENVSAVVGLIVVGPGNATPGGSGGPGLSLGGTTTVALGVFGVGVVLAVAWFVIRRRPPRSRPAPEGAPEPESSSRGRDEGAVG